MTILTKAQRAFLDTTVQKARTQSEAAAAHALRRLTVTDTRPGAHLSEAERSLRRELREKAGQLGDVPESGAAPLLVADIGYEQWHRLLFARFLEVNGLLRHPGMGVAVTLEDCGDLAADLCEPDAWSVAARFASEILPGVFRLTDPSVLVRYAREDLAALEALLASIPEETLRAEDALGWVYQFWQTAQKKAVNESGRKISGADISPVTQLFTENYMVRFLLENSLGAWWAGKHPDSPLLDDWDYLRRLEDRTPAAGTFDEWPETAAEVTVMDPCCGSGHFLIAAFGMLWRMRAEEEGLSKVDAQDAVLRENIFGLELDPRCTQIAAFNLVLEAWKQGGWRAIGRPQVWCSGVAARGESSAWTGLAGGDAALQASLESLHTQFRNAESLGSLISPRRVIRQRDLFSPDYARLAEALRTALANELVSEVDTVVSDLSNAAQLLDGSYTLAATNVPYLGRSKQDSVISSYTKENYPLAQGDIAMAMSERLRDFTPTGSTALVLPQSWTSQSGFRKYRQDLLRRRTLRIVARLGAGAFSAITGEVVQPILTVTTRGPAKFYGIDAGSEKGPEAKARALLVGDLRPMNPAEMIADPQARVTLGAGPANSPLSSLASAGAGIQTGDNDRFLRHFWEIDSADPRWVPYARSPKTTMPVTGRSMVLDWQAGTGELHEFITGRLGAGRTGAWIRGLQFWDKRGILVSRMGSIPATRYDGGAYADNAVAVVPDDQADVDALWAFAQSGELGRRVREIDSGINVTGGTITAVEFDVEEWRGASEKLGVVHSTTDPTQWSFDAPIEAAEYPLHVAAASLLGYQWPARGVHVDLQFADDDGIVVLPALAGERAAADRIREVLDESFATSLSSGQIEALVREGGSGSAYLGDWLRTHFFKEHCKLFQQRPFIWQIWDGRQDGFSALLDYRRLDRSTLEKVVYSTLGSWLARQRADAAAGLAGADLRLAAGDGLQKRLQLILDGEQPYDTFVRWKAASQLGDGWNPDLNDGVKCNIRPFATAGVLKPGLKVAWVARDDLHTTSAERLAAHEAQA